MPESQDDKRNGSSTAENEIDAALADIFISFPDPDLESDEEFVAELNRIARAKADKPSTTADPIEAEIDAWLDEVVGATKGASEEAKPFTFKIPKKSKLELRELGGFKSNKEYRDHVSSWAKGQVTTNQNQLITHNLENAYEGYWVLTDPDSLPNDEFLFGTHYVRRYVSVTGARTSVGKSYLAIVEALSMVAGRNLFTGEPLPRKLNVWYWNGEDPDYALKRKIIAACEFYKIEQESLVGHLFVLSGRDWKINLVDSSGRQKNEKHFTKVFNFLRRNDIDVWIADPFVDSHSVSENETTGMNVVVKTFGELAEEANCAIEIIHHTRKGKRGADISSEDLRGSSSLMSAVRSLRVLNPIKESELSELGLPGGTNGFRLKTDKNNLTKRDRTESWFELKSVPVGTLGIQTAVVVSIEAPPEREKEKEAHDWVWTAIENLAPEASSDDDGKRLLDYQTLRKEFHSIRPVKDPTDAEGEKGRADADWTRGLKRLEKDKKILVHGKGKNKTKVEIF